MSSRYLSTIGSGHLLFRIRTRKREVPQSRSRGTLMTGPTPPAPIPAQTPISRIISGHRWAWLFLIVVVTYSHHQAADRPSGGIRITTAALPARTRETPD